MADIETANMVCTIDGALQVTISGISTTLESGQIEVFTLRGFIGFTSTGGIRRATLNYVKPANGSEFNFDKACADGSQHTIQIFDGAEEYVGKGKFMKSDRAQNAQETGTASVDWVGEPKPFE